MSENMSNSTPLPWRIGDAGLTVFGPPNGNPSPVIIAHAPRVTNVYKGQTAKDNLAYIVRAANAYPVLVELVSKALDRFTDNDMVPANHELAEWITQAIAALEQAQGATP